MKNLLLLPLLLIIIQNSYVFCQTDMSDLVYLVKPNESLWGIATSFYGDHDAHHALYEINKKILDKVWSNAEKTHPNLKQKYPNKQDYIIPNIKIQVPYKVDYKQIFFIRNDLQVNMELINSIKDNNNELSLPLLKKAVINDESFVDVIEEAPHPLEGYIDISIKSDKLKNRDRGQPPVWWNNPNETSDFQLCSKLICNKYTQLCYFDCLTLSKRLYDAFDDKTAMMKKCKNLPDQLPFQLDSNVECNHDF